MSGRARSERGAVAVEAALVTPLLVLVLFGIVEMSLLMRDTVSVNSSVRVAARVASVSAAAGPGTCEASGLTPPPCTPADAPALGQAAANAIQRAGSAMPKDSIERVLIYEAAGTAGIPIGKTAPWTDRTCGSTNCVTYVWDKVLDKFRYSTGSWRTSTLNACVNDPNADAVGVALIARHDWITGLIGSGDGFTMTERSVMQFEPLPHETCMPGLHP